MRSVVVSGARQLAMACHPLPTLAVTAISAGLARLAGLDLGTGILVTLAVFTGQLSIGWSNDRIDAVRDRAVQRAGKPIAAGRLSAPVVTLAIAVALLATTGLSLSLGVRAGLISLLSVACGWAYNLGLKATPWSWLPYAVAFALLPAIASLARPVPRWPAAWAMAGGALIGVGAHFANVLPDLASDEATGVRGLPHRLADRWGVRVPAVVGPVLLAAAGVVIVFGSTTGSTHSSWSLLSKLLVAAAGAAVAVIVAIIGLARPSSRWLFAATVAIAVADVALFAWAGGRLT